MKTTPFVSRREVLSSVVFPDDDSTLDIHRRPHGVSVLVPPAARVGPALQVQVKQAAGYRLRAGLEPLAEAGALVRGAALLRRHRLAAGQREWQQCSKKKTLAHGVPL
ncbi:MAG TPA: hypothetical protein VGO22_21090 [Pseudorhizobium sp.]|jgi:hypothetical protein|nr:hypothetical protein [Pseudorhizobium sp.]